MTNWNISLEMRNENGSRVPQAEQSPKTKAPKFDNAGKGKPDDASPRLQILDRKWSYKLVQVFFPH